MHPLCREELALRLEELRELSKNAQLASLFVGHDALLLPVAPRAP